MKLLSPEVMPEYPVSIQVIPCWLSGWKTHRISSSPMTNVGSERPTSTAIEDTRSKTDLARVALMIPTARPKISHKTMPPITSETVAGRSCLSIVSTDSWLK